MSAKVIDLDERRPQPGNGAREMLCKFFSESEVDHFLAMMWAEGYVLVPIPPTDDVA